MSKPDIQEALAEVMHEDAARCQVTVDHAMAELVKVGFANMMDYMRIGEDGDPFVDLSHLTRAQAAGLIGFEVHDYKDGRGEDARDIRAVKIRMADKVRPLTELIKLLKPAAGPGGWGRHRSRQNRGPGADADREAGGDRAALSAGACEGEEG